MSGAIERRAGSASGVGMEGGVRAHVAREGGASREVGSCGRIEAPTSMQTERRSAPVQFGHKRASSSKRMSRSQFIAREWI